MIKKSEQFVKWHCQVSWHPKINKMFLQTIVIIVALLIGRPSAYSQIPALSVEYATNCNNDDTIQKEKIQKSNVANILKEHLNQEFNLTHTIGLKFSCTEEEDYEGPYYDPESREVIIPYYFRTYVRRNFKKSGYGDDEDELDTVTDDVLLHTIYHEIGHALIDALNLPITGKEEDAVDELSTLLLLEAYEDGDEVAISAGDFFDIEASQLEDITKSELYGLPSLDEQRFFNIICLVYGENPDGRTDLLEELDISEARKETCIYDFEKRSEAWSTLLKPYRK